jgi:hypothetical protein
MAKKRVKKYVLDFSDQPIGFQMKIIGIKSHAPLHKLAFYLNKSFGFQFYLHPNKININRKKKNLEFEFFTIPSDENEERIFLVNNETLYEIEDPFGGLFSSSEAFYMIPELENINYLLFLHNDFPIDIPELQQQFEASFQTKWVEINMEKINNSIPNFPVF